MASSTERELLAAIVAAPDDDAPRLVYADWLLERGNVRGSLIIAQCTIAAYEARGDRRSLEYRRARQSETRNGGLRGHTWPTSVGVPSRHEGMRRGFLTNTALPLEYVQSLRQHIPGLPLDCISFEPTDSPITVRDLREAREFGRSTFVGEVKIVSPSGSVCFYAPGLFGLLDQGVPDDVVVWDDRALPTSPFVDLVTFLELRDEPEAALGLGLLPRLRHLRMIAPGIRPELLRFAPRLDRLEIFGAREEAAIAILEHGLGRLDSLTLVSLHPNDISAKPEVWSRKVTDAFNASDPTPKHLMASFPVDRGVAQRNLHTLVAAGGLDRSASELLGPNLHRLVVFGFDDAPEIAEAPLPALSDLAFVRCDLTGDRLKKLERLTELSTLAFASCQHKPKAMTALLGSKALEGVPMITVGPARFYPELEALSVERNRYCQALA